MKIYTRKGDKGETNLFTGQKVSKNDPVIEALGTVDECSSAIGASISLIPPHTSYTKIKTQLIAIQNALFDVGAAIATPRSRAEPSQINVTRFNPQATARLEKWIDELEEELPPLHHFILPGGHPCGAMLHLARCVCRRIERVIVPLSNHADISDNVMMYLNRLSDYLFVASRYLNHLSQVQESTWEHHNK